MESMFFCAEDFFGLTKVDANRDWHEENIRNWAPKAAERRRHSNYNLGSGGEAPDSLTI